MRTQMSGLDDIPQLLTEITNAIRGSKDWRPMPGIPEHPEMKSYTVKSGRWTFIVLSAPVDGGEVYDGTGSDTERFQIVRLTPDLAKEAFQLAVAEQSSSK